MATNFLKFCSMGNKGGMALVSAAGVLGWDCDAGEGSMWTESVEGKGKLFSWCSSTTSSVSNRGTASFFSHG